METSDISRKLREKGLKPTPQRINILAAIEKLGNHPTADKIIDHIRRTNLNISVATVYRVLEVLTENGLIHKVRTENDIMRYDAFLDPHHHIYFMGTDQIEDYSDQELQELLREYFSRKPVPGLDIVDLKLQIIGKQKI